MQYPTPDSRRAGHRAPTRPKHPARHTCAARASASTRAADPAAVPPALEPLEPRVLLSAVLFADGDFNLDGTPDRFLVNTEFDRTGIQLRSRDGGVLGNFATPHVDLDTDRLLNIADYNGDGRDDLLWRSASAQRIIWLTHRDGKGVDVSFAAPDLLPDNPVTAPVATADFNGDGYLDRFYHNQGTGQTTVEIRRNGNILGSRNLLEVTTTWWNIAAVGDTNDDGRADILWVNRNGDRLLWEMYGLNYRLIRLNNPSTPDNPGTPSTPGPPTDPPRFSADFDGDGDQDRFFHDAATNQTRVQLLQGGTVVADKLLPRVNAQTWTATDAADFTGDGKDDILWLRNDGTAVRWAMDGTRFSGAFFAATPGTGWRYHASADADNDGDLDLLWDTPDDGLQAWFLDGTTVTRTGPATVTEPDTFDPGDDTDPVHSVFYIGHSLIDTRGPAYVDFIAEQNGAGPDRVGFSLLWGSSLKDHAITEGAGNDPDAGTNVYTALRTTPWDAVVLAEGTPLFAQLQFSESVRYATEFALEALHTNPDTQLFLYDHWPSRRILPDGTPRYAAGTTEQTADTWDAQVLLEQQRIEQLIADTNEQIRHSVPDAKPVKIIPAGAALLALKRRIASGAFTPTGSIQRFDDIFISDGLHLKDAGHFLASATLYASIYRDNPVDHLTSGKLLGINGQTTLNISLPLAKQLAQIAWDVVRTQS